MENNKNKWWIISLTLLGSFITLMLIFFYVLNVYDRQFRFPFLNFAILAIALSTIVAAFVFSIIAIKKTPRKAIPITIGVFIYISIIASVFIILPLYSLYYSLGYNDYNKFQNRYGTPEKFLSYDDGSTYYLVNNKYHYTNENKVYDSDGTIHHLIYKATYQKVEKINDNDKDDQKFVKYYCSDDVYLIIFEDGEGYIYENSDILYSGGKQCLKYSKDSALEIIETANQIIENYLNK